MNCTNCGSSKVAELRPGTGTHYVLTEFDKNTNTVMPANFLTLDVIGCANCGMLFIMSEELKGLEPQN